MLEISIQTQGFFKESETRQRIQFIHECGFEAGGGILFLSRAVRAEGCKLVSAIGRYFRERILT